MSACLQEVSEAAYKKVATRHNIRIDIASALVAMEQMGDAVESGVTDPKELERIIDSVWEAGDLERISEELPDRPMPL